MSVSKQQKTVMVFGTFDILHHGHISLFHQAREYGEKLLVVVSRDSRVEILKGARPMFTQRERVTLLRELRCVDEVILGGIRDVYQVIKETKPDVIVLGYDQCHFTEGLEKVITGFGLQTKVVRAKAHKPKAHKTKILKQKMNHAI